ncbi:MAG: hypothetical protein JW809_10770 [Pirellulales bacterium]|nr:hypothetical protein [Pirellulales bacterium]
MNRFMPFVILGLLIVLTPPSAADDADLAAPLPPGETSLLDVGTRQVFWQSYGQEPVAMPAGGEGMESASGATFEERDNLLGRRAVFMHSPWRVPTGKIWVDYRLALPRTAPIRLALGIAMSPEAAAPGKSDGVTFSCHVLAEGQTTELLRQHHARAEWIDRTFDLAPFAGKTIVVRLQVEPGPKNNSAFDFSHFGDPRITVGSAPADRSAVPRRVTESRAYRAVADRGAAALGNTHEDGVTPSNILSAENRLESSDGQWRFVYEGDDCRVVYAYRPASGTLDDFTVRVDDGRPFAPARGGGITIASADAPREPVARGGKPVRIAASDNAPSLAVLWAYPATDGELRVAWTYRIVGKALVVSARCDEPAIGRFSLGEPGTVPFRRRIAVPYLPGGVVYLPGENLFMARCLDWTVSHASRCPQGLAIYEPKTDGARNALAETGYVAVSPELGEVLPNVPHPPSPYRELLGPRIMLDIWGHHQGTYQGDAENLRTLKDHGVDHLAIISHVWQRWGYDVKLPDHLPANPAFGGDEGMIAFGRAANACGYVWSLHENYIDLYPDAPSYDPTVRVLLADGSPSKAWYNAGTGVQSFGLKCNRAIQFAQRNAPEIHRRYGTTAAYLDVHTCVPPWHQLDHEAGQPMAAMLLGKVKCDGELFAFMRDAHGGPLFGEGANHVYWAGRCDGVEAQVVGGEDHAPLLDFDLLKLHAQMVNHGMGYYERWFRRGYEHRWGRDTGTMEQIDKYRAQELAYGHAGFVGADQVDNVQWVVREHHLVHPVQRLYATATPRSIRYEIDGQWVAASAAVTAGNTLRQRVQYNSGLTLWVNWAAEPWHVEGRTLPQWGFLALGPDTEVSTSLHGERIADCARCPEYVFVDARTSIAMPYVRARKQIEPQLKSFKHLGGGKVEVTYEWIVDDTLDGDYHCFVHGVAPTGAGPDRIVFQQDHAPPKPTNQWRKGDRIVDGSYTLAWPETLDAATLVVGLYKANAPRVPLTGVQQGDDRIAIAQCRAERKDGRIADIQAEVVAASASRDTVEADFRARINPPDTWIDFGPVATDGSVMVRREGDRLVLYPYPRGRRFRVSLDVKALLPEADPARLVVRVLSVGEGRDLGPVDATADKGRLTLTVGAPGAGRYAIERESR